MNFPVTFLTYMQEALYGPNGYYMVDRSRFGRVGDFYTSTQVSPLYGDLWAHFIAQRPEYRASDITVVEFGIGDGHLAESLVEGLLRHPLVTQAVCYIGLDQSPTALARTRDRLQKLEGRAQVYVVHSVTELPHEVRSRLPGAFVLGNEVLDAIPCEILRVTNSEVSRLMVTTHADWSGIAVGPYAGEKLVTYFEQTQDCSCLEYANRYIRPVNDMDAPIEGVNDDVIAEAGVLLPQFLRHVHETIQPAYIAFVDYGGFAEDLIASDRPQGTLRAYRSHQLLDVFLDQTGECDLTYDVNFTMLTDELERLGYDVVPPVRQGSFFMSLPDIHNFLSERMKEDTKMASALKHLVLPGGLGDRFLISIAQRKGEK